MSSKPRVVLMTDFGVDNMGTAAMEGVISTIDNELICTNLTHRIAPFNTWQASGALMYVVPFWPAGTVFVSVVDPGVGCRGRQRGRMSWEITGGKQDGMEGEKEEDKGSW